ncbi:MAG: hypothetical protein J5701_08730 [Bacteroidales bacterium]|nr:hypothetical protein [Bacteroidales bacterium]
MQKTKKNRRILPVPPSSPYTIQKNTFLPLPTTTAHSRSHTGCLIRWYITGLVNQIFIL